VYYTFISSTFVFNSIHFDNNILDEENVYQLAVLVLLKYFSV